LSEPDEDLGAAVGIGQCDRDRYLAAQRRIARLELNGFDYLLVRHQPHKAAVVGVGVGGRLARPGRRIIGQ
jgi:hypothetical protein